MGGLSRGAGGRKGGGVVRIEQGTVAGSAVVGVHGGPAGTESPPVLTRRPHAATQYCHMGILKALCYSWG